MKATSIGAFDLSTDWACPPPTPNVQTVLMSMSVKTASASLPFSAVRLMPHEFSFTPFQRIIGLVLSLFFFFTQAPLQSSLSRIIFQKLNSRCCACGHSEPADPSVESILGCSDRALQQEWPKCCTEQKAASKKARVHLQPLRHENPQAQRNRPGSPPESMLESVIFSSPTRRYTHQRPVSIFFSPTLVVFRRRRWPRRRSNADQSVYMSRQMTRQRETFTLVLATDMWRQSPKSLRS